MYLLVGFVYRDLADGVGGDVEEANLTDRHECLFDNGANDGSLVEEQFRLIDLGDLFVLVLYHLDLNGTVLKHDFLSVDDLSLYTM